MCGPSDHNYYNDILRVNYVMRKYILQLGYKLHITLLNTSIIFQYQGNEKNANKKCLLIN